MKIESHALKEVAGLFLKLGLVAFGGPAAHISMMQQEVVYKRNWMTEEHFLDLLGATNLIPGPNSTEMAIHLGYERAGWKGLIAAGVLFILPAAFITGCFAWLYKSYGMLPQVQPFIYGIKPAIIAIILAAVFPLAKRSAKNLKLIIIGISALVLALAGWNEIYIMLGAGIIMMIIYAIQNKKLNATGGVFVPFTLLQTPITSIITVTNTQLFFSFLKIGSILYGSGYVLFAFLDTELVKKGIITRQLLVDAIAVGQFTPGPVSSAVTFIGYQLNGFSGAAISTLGVFLPCFVFVALLNPLVKKMRSSKIFAAFLDAVNIASVAVIVAVCFAIGKESITDWRTILIACVSTVVVFGFKKVNTVFIVFGGSLLGYFLSLV
jgi:chromate transporter